MKALGRALAGGVLGAVVGAVVARRVRIALVRRATTPAPAVVDSVYATVSEGVARRLDERLRFDRKAPELAARGVHPAIIGEIRWIEDRVDVADALLAEDQSVIDGLNRAYGRLQEVVSEFSDSSEGGETASHAPSPCCAPAEAPVDAPSAPSRRVDGEGICGDRLATHAYTLVCDRAPGHDGQHQCAATANGVPCTLGWGGAS